LKCGFLDLNFALLIYCISYRINNTRRRRLRTDLRTRPRLSRRSSASRRRTNWSSEPEFGNLWLSCPYPYSRRQAPDISHYFNYTAIYTIYFISCIKSRNCGETLDAWILGIQCNTPESLSDRCFANRTGKSRVISCHSRDIGVACLNSCNHYKDDGQGHVLYHDLKFYPVCLVKSFKAEMYGSGG
jgi:hypothetical protein